MSEANTNTENLLNILIRQREIAMTACAQLEAELLAMKQKLTAYESKEQAEDLFKDTDKE
jgi:hypothetical protein